MIRNWYEWDDDTRLKYLEDRGKFLEEKDW